MDSEDYWRGHAAYYLKRRGRIVLMGVLFAGAAIGTIAMALRYFVEGRFP